MGRTDQALIRIFLDCVRQKLNGLVEMPRAVIMNAINCQIFADDLLPRQVKLAIRMNHAYKAIITSYT